MSTQPKTMINWWYSNRIKVKTILMTILTQQINDSTIRKSCTVTKFNKLMLFFFKNWVKNTIWWLIRWIWKQIKMIGIWSNFFENFEILICNNVKEGNFRRIEKNNEQRNCRLSIDCIYGGKWVKHKFWVEKEVKIKNNLNFSGLVILRENLNFCRRNPS